MIKINQLMEIQKLGEKNENLIDLILDVDVSEDIYNRIGTNEEECPKDAWTLYVTQNDGDREINSIWFCLCNEGSESGLIFTEEEKSHIYNYVKENNLDITAGIILNETTSIITS